LTWIGVLLATMPTAAQTTGVLPEWEVKKMVDSLVAQVRRFGPLLSEVKPQEWQGASSAFQGQLKTTSAASEYLVQEADALAARPDRVTRALTVYFRMQAVEAMIASLAQGVRTYQNPALAELLEGALRDNSSAGEQLRQYLVDLATAKESEFDVIDKEAQRCREGLARQPNRPRPVEPKTNPK
jgi:hypothetical protein